MSSLREIESAVKSLNRDELMAFRHWFLEYDAQSWDQQFDLDVNAGRLDELAAEARSEFRAGRCTDR